jgi:hypothetical protein
MENSNILHREKKWTCSKVLIAIHDKSLRDQIAAAVKEIGDQVEWGLDGDITSMADIVAPQVYARIIDTYSFRIIADDLREYLAETDDEIPLCFLGNDWRPAFYHRSVLDINGVAMDQLKNILQQAKAYYHSEEHNLHPYLLYPNNMVAYIDVDTDWVTHAIKVDEGQEN